MNIAAIKDAIQRAIEGRYLAPLLTLATSFAQKEDWTPETIDAFLEATADDPTSISPALLHCVSELIEDNVARARAQRLTVRSLHGKATWVADIRHTTLGPIALKVPQYSGDITHYAWELKPPGAQTCVAVLSVDEINGGSVDDFSVVAIDFAGFREQVAQQDIAQKIEEIPLAQVARVTLAALERNLVFNEPVQENSWPTTQPILEWCRQRFPAPAVLSPADRDAVSWEEAMQLVEEFTKAHHLNEEDYLRTLELTHLATSRHCRHPLKWSPTRVSLMMQLVETKLEEDPEDFYSEGYGEEEVEAYREVLTKFVSWSMKRIGAPHDVIEATLEELAHPS
ncbi:hypothetical protein CPHO_12075 [Corynebacterium phocae]|uniref:Uncharacterized protein n=1 Tax=Corynebacterium phocae TaxID=161895 RepID=A0A1L7D604_9CORY|nr:hypothetical protein [Corynebacterium phocae]APT93507.1 hypothetical protein CPHO_12075 [Corynebacterium phocae]KAA8720587.1 hypothetical protein F4V58_11520 [Corynebacterium phocae]